MPISPFGPYASGGLGSPRSMGPSVPLPSPPPHLDPMPGRSGVQAPPPAPPGCWPPPSSLRSRRREGGILAGPGRLSLKPGI